MAEANPQIHLTLSKDEADALRTVLRFVGGDPDTTRRGHIDEIKAALDRAGAKYDASDVFRGCEGLRFLKPGTPKY